MSRWIATALVLAVAASGCVADDSARKTSAVASEDDELRAELERIAQLETEVAETREAAQDAEGPSHVTEWERQPVPRKFRPSGGPGFPHADTLLFSIADHFVDPRPEDAGVVVTVRTANDDGDVVGEIVVDGYLDDSVRGHEYRATLRREGDAWHVERLMRRQLCWRGGGKDACV